MQKITTTGNATFIAYDNVPIIATDPWYGDQDPAYFGSWMCSHEIPLSLKKDIQDCKYLWFSHGHPDHLNPISIERFKGKKILLPDHYNSRIFNDLKSSSYDVEILPDRKWVNLTDKIKVLCITTFIQDSILLIDVCGKLFINLNDSGAKSCSSFIRKISERYNEVFLLSLSGYGDADMINFYDEDDNFILPPAAKKEKPGIMLSQFCKLVGANSVIPFSSFHQYQREDSIWAQKYTTPIDSYREGLDKSIKFYEPFVIIDCNSLESENYNPNRTKIIIKKSEDFGDSWSDQLSKEDCNKIYNYFFKKERVRNFFGFINFVVGSKQHTFKLEGKKNRGITFEVPRHSLMQAVEYKIFDDLLIGNFMKTTLHNCNSLYEGRGNFGYNVAKFSDNGLADSEEEITNYIKNYKKRAGYEFLLSTFEDKSKDFIIRFFNKDSKIFNLLKKSYLIIR